MKFKFEYLSILSIFLIILVLREAKVNHAMDLPAPYRLWERNPMVPMAVKVHFKVKANFMQGTG